MRNESLSQGQNNRRDESVWMSDITYAAVEIVRLMNPKIRTRHHRPKNTLTRTPFDSYYFWKAEVEMVQRVESKRSRYIALVFFSTGSAVGGRRRKLKVLRLGQMAARRRRSCYSADKMHKQKASIDAG